MSLNITKTGIFNGQIVEPFLTLPDGSKWILLCYHYIDNGNHLFTKEKAPYCNEQGLYSRCKYADYYKYNNIYEYYVIQDGTIYRWTQTNTPSASSLSGFTPIIGSPSVGLVRNGGNTYFGYNSWWGAVGCWTKWSSGGYTGVPGFGGITAHGYLAVYARINDFNAFAEDKIINGNEIYEY